MKNLKSHVLATAVKILNNPSALTLPFFAFVAWATWAARTHFFFWDTVQLGSQHAQFFYNSSFSTFLLPDDMDSGHPPTFGFYLAIVWKIMGKSLENSHLAMLPFLFGIVWQAWRLGEKLLGEGWAYVFMLLLWVNPVVASQCVLVSPDVALLFFFLMALNCLFREQKTLLALAILGLAAVSMRGMMVVAALFFFHILKDRLVKRIKLVPSEAKFATHTEGGDFSPKALFFNIISVATPYFLGVSFAVGFFLYHFTHKGWIGYFAGSSWAESFQLVDFKGFIKNIVLLIWRLFDFGHVFVFIFILFLSLKIKRKTLPFFATTQKLWLLLCVLIVVLTPTLLAYQALLNHRYLLPIYVVACLLCVKLISDMKEWRQQMVFSIILVLGLGSGNFWVYPQPIATGWDSTLAHLPYYHLRNSMIQYIDNQGINHSKIGTAFPNLRSFDLIDLKNTPPVQSFARLDLSKNRYVFYSNVMNELTADQLNELRQTWSVEKILRGGQIEVILYKK
ncbi:MAG: hypothetical protein JNL70_15435 [Saprospiraceae bacterium]|nr:hypothetical protein [Saprospiraceae bacterium]